MKGRTATACLLSFAILLVACQQSTQVDPAQAKKDYDAAVVRAEKLGLPTTSTDPYPPVPDDQNAALTGAFDLHKNPPPPFPLDHTATLKEIEALVQKGEVGAKKVEAAALLPAYRIPDDPTLLTSFPGNAGLKSWTKYFVAKAKLDFAQNHLDEARNDFSICPRFADFAGQSHEYIATMVALAVQSITQDAALDLVRNDKFSQKSIDVVRPALQDLPVPDFGQVTLANMRFELGSIVSTTKEYNDEVTSGKIKKEGAKEINLDSVLAKFLNNRCDTFEIIQANKTDLPQMYQKLGKLKIEIEAKYPEDDSVESMFHTIANPTLDGEVLNAVLRSTSYQRLTLIGLDIISYKNLHGQLPKTLDDLKTTDDFTDPWTNKPFLYKPQEKGFLLYSVGKDGKDDGGATQPVDKDSNWAPDITFQTINPNAALLCNGQ